MICVCRLCNRAEVAHCHQCKCLLKTLFYHFAYNSLKLCQLPVNPPNLFAFLSELLRPD